MKKLKLEIEVGFEGDLMHGNDPESIEWFKDAVLLNPDKDEQLILHSNCIGDSVGECKVTKIISGI
jgi:hypothetical protein